jgi:pimeloyl-ACP methyl ester carboxylesterase
MRLAYDRTGSGTPVLLLHGLGGYRGLWRPVSEVIGDRRDLIAPDLPGFGESPALDGDGPASAAALAEPVAALCEELGISRPHVAGNSLGAWVGLEMAKRGQVSSVVGISVAGLWREPLGPRRYDTQGLGRLLGPLLGVMLNTEAGRRRVLATTMAHPERVPAADARELVRSYVGAPGYRAANEAMRAEPFEHEGLIDVPVTFAWGDRDRLVKPPSRSRMPPGATSLTKPGWGHTPTWDDPEGVAALILEASEEGPRG